MRAIAQVEEQQRSGGETSFWTGWGYERKVSHFVWGGAGVHGKASEVHWRNWGSKKSLGRGKARVCFSTGGGCQKVKRFTVTLSERHGYIGAESRQYMYCKTMIGGRVNGRKFHSAFRPPAVFC